MRILQETPELNQRELADNLGISVGGLNVLSDEPFVKTGNFHNIKNKFNYINLLTPPGHC